MQATAKVTGVRVTPRKCRLVIDLIRGKKALDAMAILKNTNTKSSRLISKVLNSACANATNNFNMKLEDLVISECFINPGPVLKRSKIGSRSNVDRRDKRTSHITVKVSDGVKEA